MNDLISRQAAIDVMCAACWDWCDEGVCKRVSAIQQLPSARPEQQWIPCSERLPEKEGWYLISVKTGNVTKAFYRVAPIKRGGCYWRGHVTKPTAWMPLPKPYGGEQDG